MIRRYKLCAVLLSRVDRSRRNSRAGEGPHAHAQGSIVDVVRSYVNVDKYQPVGRQFGNYYAPLDEKVMLKRKA